MLKHCIKGVIRTEASGSLVFLWSEITELHQQTTGGKENCDKINSINPPVGGLPAPPLQHFQLCLRITNFYNKIDVRPHIDFVTNSDL